MSRATATAPITVLAFNDYYLPGYRGGGPVTSLRNMVEQLAPTLDFSIVTQDRDLGDASPYAGVRRGTWTPVEAGRVLYLKPSTFWVIHLLRVIRKTPHDVVYLNSFFSPRFTLPVLMLRRLGLLADRPIVLAVRGEFSPGALALKPRKKALYLRFAKRTGLLRPVLFQATTEEEAGYIRGVLGNAVAVQTAPCLASPTRLVDTQAEEAGEARPLKLVFLSRISPMKNLDFALDVLGGVTQDVEFSIYGPIEDDNYWAGCQAKIAKLPAHVQVSYHGSVEPQQVVSVLRPHDVFFLPTRGENFGHVIVEALSAGCVALISDRTPWKDLEAHQCGAALPLEQPASFSAKIDELARLDRQALERMSTQALTYAARITNDAAAVEASLKLFRSAGRRTSA